MILAIIFLFILSDLIVRSKNSSYKINSKFFRCNRDFNVLIISKKFNIYFNKISNLYLLNLENNKDVFSICVCNIEFVYIKKLKK